MAAGLTQGHQGKDATGRRHLGRGSRTQTVGTGVQGVREGAEVDSATPPANCVGGGACDPHYWVVPPLWVPSGPNFLRACLGPPRIRT